MNAPPSSGRRWLRPGWSHVCLVQTPGRAGWHGGETYAQANRTNVAASACHSSFACVAQAACPSVPAAASCGSFKLRGEYHIRLAACGMHVPLRECAQQPTNLHEQDAASVPSASHTHAVMRARMRDPRSPVNACVCALCECAQCAHDLERCKLDLRLEVTRQYLVILLPVDDAPDAGPLPRRRCAPV